MPSGVPLYYTRKFGYFLGFLDFIPEMRDIKTGRTRLPSELKTIYFRSSQEVSAAVATLSSSMFYWFWSVLSDCRNLNKRDILAFPVAFSFMPLDATASLAELGQQYISELRSTSHPMTKSGCRIETFDYAACKPVLDSIDHVLGEFFSLRQEEIDFITHYDLKYRMGAEEELEDEYGIPNAVLSAE